MKFQKGDILRRNSAYEAHALKQGAMPRRLTQMTELYESEADTNGDPFCIVVRSTRPERLGRKFFFSAEWVEIAEYS